MDGWNTSLLLGLPIFRCYVSFRECIHDIRNYWDVLSPFIHHHKGISRCHLKLGGDTAQFRDVHVFVPLSKTNIAMEINMILQMLIQFTVYPFLLNIEQSS